MITKEVAMNLLIGQTLYHKTEKNSDGTALRCRVNGKCKIWKTRPDDFRIPMKWGMWNHFYIEYTDSSDGYGWSNPNDWENSDVTYR